MISDRNVFQDFRSSFSLALVFTLMLFGCLIMKEPPPASKGQGAGAVQVPETSLAAYLPDPSRLNAWNPDGEPELYKGEDLFIYINGGAEIYYEYGFKELLVQRYKGPSGKSITLELYRMTDSDAAYGIYSFKRGEKAEAVFYGDEGLLEDYYLNFWKADLAITLIGQDDQLQTVNGLHALAEAVDNKILGTGGLPRLVQSLPQEGLIKNSTKFLSGPIGFFNCCTFLPRNVIKFEVAVSGSYENGGQIFVFRCSNALTCEEILSNVRQAFHTDNDYSSFKSQGNAFTIRDATNRLFHVQPMNECIVILLTSNWNLENETLLERLKQNLCSGPASI